MDGSRRVMISFWLSSWPTSRSMSTNLGPSLYHSPRSGLGASLRSTDGSRWEIDAGGRPSEPFQSTRIRCPAASLEELYMTEHIALRGQVTADGYCGDSAPCPLPQPVRIHELVGVGPNTTVAEALRSGH